MREEHGGSAHAAAGRREFGEQLHSVNFRRLPSGEKAWQRKRCEGRNSEVGSGLRLSFSNKRRGWLEAALPSGRSEAGCGAGREPAASSPAKWRTSLRGLSGFTGLPYSLGPALFSCQWCLWIFPFFVLPGGERKRKLFPPLSVLTHGEKSVFLIIGSLLLDVS